MKFKMNQNSIFAMLLRSPWWISAGIALFIALIAAAVVPRPYIIYGIFTGFPFMVISVIALRRQWGKPSATRAAEILQAVRAMSWRDFSVEIENALKRDGFEVTRINLPDADFSITSEGRTALVSCKRWKAASTGIEILRDLQKAREDKAAHDAFYITSGGFTQNAMQFAVENKMRLVHGEGLAKLLRKMKTEPVK